MWLLLHFRYCDQPFRVFNDVFSQLRVHLPDYSKADRKIFVTVGAEEGLHKAMLHSSRLRTASKKSGAPSMVIANSIKGKGVSFMENNFNWHHGGIDDLKFTTALSELATSTVSS